MNKIINGNNIDVLKTFPDNYFDAIITDPPYGLGKEPDASEVMKDWIEKGFHEVSGSGFMNFEWDAFVPQPLFWKEAFRVLKHGGHVLSFFGTRTYDWGVMSMRFAGFEIRDSITWNYACLSEDTLCLTKRGYIPFYKLTKEDYIAEWDSKTNEIKWEIIGDILIYDAPKEMIHIKNRHTDQLLTENHTVYAKIQRHTRNKKAIAYEAIQVSQLKKHWIKWFPIAGNLFSGNHIENAYMIGWWLTDAWMHKDGKACMFSQSKPYTRKKLIEGLENSDCNFSEYIKQPQKDTHQAEYTYYVTGRLSEYLIKNFPKRELTWDVLEWSFDCRKQLYKGLMHGDGSAGRAFWSKIPERLEIFSALCTTLNIRSHIDYKKGVVYLNEKTNYTQIQSCHILDKITYTNKKVWCLKTNSGAFVVMRNGRNFITGNSGFPKSHNISVSIDKIYGQEREVIGQREDILKKQAKDLKSGKRKIVESLNNGSPDRNNGFVKVSADVTAPSSDDAKKYDGFGTALKPASEPIVLARKPLEKGLTIAQNVLKWGTGGINIDGCRISTDETITNHSRGSESSISKGKYGDSKQQETHQTQGQQNGRFPANVIYTHHPECCCIGTKKVKSNGHHSHKLPENGGTIKLGLKEMIDEGNIYAENGKETIEEWECVDGCPIKLLNEQSGVLKSGKPSGVRNTEGGYHGKYGEIPVTGYGDTGSASRFFLNTYYSDEDLNFERFFYQAKASRSERNKGTENIENDNSHPTVKPVTLMRYLVKLITPPNGIILDPFVGSGTTGISAKVEGFNFIGIEQDAEYCKIAEARIQAWSPEMGTKKTVGKGKRKNVDDSKKNNPQKQLF